MLQQAVLVTVSAADKRDHSTNRCCAQKQSGNEWVICYKES